MSLGAINYISVPINLDRLGRVAIVVLVSRPLTIFNLLTHLVDVVDRFTCKLIVLNK